MNSIEIFLLKHGGPLAQLVERATVKMSIIGSYRQVSQGRWFDPSMVRPIFGNS
jgi:hypothetical protein